MTQFQKITDTIGISYNNGTFTLPEGIFLITLHASLKVLKNKYRDLNVSLFKNNIEYCSAGAVVDINNSAIAMQEAFDGTLTCVLNSKDTFSFQVDSSSGVEPVMQSYTDWHLVIKKLD